MLKITLEGLQGTFISVTEGNTRRISLVIISSILPSLSFQERSDVFLLSESEQQIAQRCRAFGMTKQGLQSLSSGTKAIPSWNGKHVSRIGLSGRVPHLSRFERWDVQYELHFSCSLRLFPSHLESTQADVAQLVEQPIRNRQVIGSSPIVGSTPIPFRRKELLHCSI